MFLIFSIQTSGRVWTNYRTQRLLILEQEPNKTCQRPNHLAPCFSLQHVTTSHLSNFNQHTNASQLLPSTRKGFCREPKNYSPPSSGLAPRNSKMSRLFVYREMYCTSSLLKEIFEKAPRSSQWWSSVLFIAVEWVYHVRRLNHFSRLKPHRRWLKPITAQYVDTNKYCNNVGAHQP